MKTLKKYYYMCYTINPYTLHTTDNIRRWRRQKCAQVQTINQYAFTNNSFIHYSCGKVMVFNSWNLIIHLKFIFRLNLSSFYPSFTLPPIGFDRSKKKTKNTSYFGRPQNSPLTLMVNTLLDMYLITVVR